MLIDNKPRSKVSIDDRRAIFPAARAFKPVVGVTREQFIRKALATRLNIPAKTEMPESIVSTAKELAATINAQVKAEKDAADARFEAEMAAKEAAAAAKEAE